MLRNGVVHAWELWLGAAGMLLLLEAARRVLGKEMLIMAGAFLAYAYAGRWIPGILGHRGYGGRLLAPRSVRHDLSSGLGTL